MGLGLALLSFPLAIDNGLQIVLRLNVIGREENGCATVFNRFIKSLFGYVNIAEEDMGLLQLRV